MVAYAIWGRRDFSPAFVMEALQDRVYVSVEWVSVIPYRPEDFLIVFGQAEHRNRVNVLPFMDHYGVRLYFRPQNTQSQAVHAMVGLKVHLVLEGIPVHVWDREVV
ncbi:hypothetical protein ZWY2020_029219 [Hordeum vulgare]|nr:hypothetical protein ZWY2020_029219 [Hordeum vulgare]